MTPVKEIGNTDLVLLATLLAGGGDSFADVEDIAVEAYRLSPQRFGWRTKPYPSDKIVVQAIADLEAKHRKKQSLTMRGSSVQADKVATRKLTAEGRRVALQVGSQLAGRNFVDVASLKAHFQSSDANVAELTAADRRRAQADLIELRRHRAFQEWADGGDLSTLERWQLLDAINCLPDSPEWSIQDQSEKLTALAEHWKDTDVLRFMAAFAEQTEHGKGELPKGV